MALLWSAVWSLSWLLLQLAKLALHLTPAAASLTTLSAPVLVSIMTTQALEHSVLALVHRSKWYQTSSYDDLRREFYCGYWLVTLLYVLASVLWIYFTKRGGNRYVYGATFCVLWWGVQLATVVALTPMKVARARMKTAFGRTFVVAWK
uniref:RxLR effector candidate protein n=1 Tax=Hyaloperonospora arabidopsidis (strain Emoy2) TaxID=559515 RepID=M4B656_HYAAE